MLLYNGLNIADNEPSSFFIIDAESTLFWWGMYGFTSRNSRFQKS